LSINNETYSTNDCSIEFSVIDVANVIGWDSDRVKYELKKLENLTVEDKFKQPEISVKFHTLGFRIIAPGDLTTDELDEALESLYHRCRSQTLSCFHRLELISTESKKFSFDSITQCLKSTEEIHSRSEQFKSTISTYFKQENLSSDATVILSKKRH
jgi:ATP-dependent DNA helicase Q4